MSITAPLAIFDLDNTLLHGDSDYSWGCFLVAQGLVDGATYESKNRHYYEQYQSGVLNIHEFLAFALQPLTQHPLAHLLQLREIFMRDIITPMILPKAEALIAEHRAQQHTLMIITATHRFITEPIAQRLGIPHLLATDPECINGAYTGRVSGIPCFQNGKVLRLQQWLSEHQATLDHSWFYSDSHNDAPLLNVVTHPVAVDPDERLRSLAEQRGWSCISLRD
ncbi:MAG: HAD family hydrolase [Gammaproteobacteria bacterium]|nr:HAD family hydrolase [Gammaproteobacteria bacterium]